MKAIDLVGRKFGRLTVIKRVENNKDGRACFLCACDCGKMSTVSGKRLLRGATKSCGCGEFRFTTENRTTHGASKSSLYRVWADNKGKCADKKNKHYGGAGVGFFGEWADSFEAFAKWAIANGYKEGLELERIDKGGDFEPGNCRWATHIQIARNLTRANAVPIRFLGEAKSLTEWAEIVGIQRGTLWRRINVYGWSVDEALTTPLRDRKRNRKECAA